MTRTRATSGSSAAADMWQTYLGTLKGFRTSRDELRPVKPAFARSSDVTADIGKSAFFPSGRGPTTRMRPMPPSIPMTGDAAGAAFETEGATPTYKNPFLWVPSSYL